MRRIILITVLLLAMPLSDIVLAQEVEVGIVSRIRERKKEVETTGRAQIWRIGEGGPVRQEAPLLDQDIVQMGRQVFLDIGFFGPNLESRAILGTRSLSDRGTYVIQRDTIDQLGGMELVVRQGVIVVEHVRGRLTAVAAGIRTEIFGTTVLIRVDESEDTGLLYLKEGSIGFTGFPDLDRIQAGASGRIFRLEQGRPPLEVMLAPDARRRWENELEYNRQSVWRARPFWQQPRFLIPAAAVAVVGAAVVLTAGGSDRATGNVVISVLE